VLFRSTYQVPDANIRIDRLTGTTDCQGLQLDPDLAWSRFRTTARSQTLKNVNINVFRKPHTGPGNRYALWLSYDDTQIKCIAGRTTLTNVWVQEPNRSLATESTWPETNRPAACRAAWSPSARRSSFPGLHNVTGVVREGRPPGGDFVPIDGNAGLRYVRPRTP